MKKYLLIATAAFVLVTPGLVFAQSTPGGGAPQEGAPGSAPSGEGQHFQQHKAQILKHMSEHIAEIQQRQSCVQAANDRKALEACLPRRGEHGEHGDHDDHDGHQGHGEGHEGGNGGE